MPDAFLRQLKERIRTHGPLTIAEYMDTCLLDPEHGYYTTREAFGTQGDFITAPEISQVFGELIGLWCAIAWMQASQPKIQLIELGPGRGTLMVDCLRATSTIPGFHEAVRVHMVEKSPRLRDIQKRALGAYSFVQWHETLEDIPEGFSLFIANEFFDALPIRQFVSTGTEWQERKVGLNAEDNLHFTIDPPKPDTLLETCEAGRAVIHEIVSRLKAHSGAALIIDYGYAMPQCADTLQALKSHTYADVLANPGEADITAHVNFPALAEGARREGALVHGPVGQGLWLKRLGAELRATKLCEHASASQREAILSGLERLVSPAQMGELFKVMAVSSSGLPTLEGFAS